MIDLREESLPNTVTVNGKAFSIETNFRAWIKFSGIIKKAMNGETVTVNNLAYLFKNEIPQGNFAPALYDFYSNPNATPNSVGISHNDVLIDYILDGEYITGSFLGQYGINTTDKKLYIHWHYFQALIRCLESTTKMSEIIQARCYHNDKNIKIEEMYEQNKRVWKLPESTTKNAQIEQELRTLFYNS